jgi:hypothetical protein
MKPGALESLRGIQVALAEAITPSLGDVYSQDVAQTLTMLLESISAEWDSAAEDLQADNEAVRTLLDRASSVIPLLDGKGSGQALAKQIEDAVSRPPSTSLLLSELAAENETLRGALESTLVALEDHAAGPASAEPMELREAIYSHLRVWSAAGWSFWDVASFRERMAAIHSRGR